MALTAAQRRNLLKLAEYLESLPRNYRHFDMFSFAAHRGNCKLPMDEDLYAAMKPAEFLSNCGTVACAVGHGPAAGIKPTPDEFQDSDFDWKGYVNRAFGVSPFSKDFDFLFQSTWTNADNHHYGAAARIRYFLATGKAHRPGRAARREYAPYRKGSRSQTRRDIEQVSA